MTRYSGVLVIVALLAAQAAPSFAEVTVTIPLSTYTQVFMKGGAVVDPPTGGDTYAVLQRLLGKYQTGERQGDSPAMVFNASEWNPDPEVTPEVRESLKKELKDFWKQYGCEVDIKEHQAPKAGPPTSPDAVSAAARIAAQKAQGVVPLVANWDYTGGAALVPEPPTPAAPVAPVAPVMAAPAPQPAPVLAPTVQTPNSAPAATPAGSYDEMIEAGVVAAAGASEHYKVSAGDLNALIKTKGYFYGRMVESNLMGVYDRTEALRAARALNLQGNIAQLIRNKDTNVKIGAWLWADALKSSGGNPDRALRLWYYGQPASEVSAAIRVFHGFLKQEAAGQAPRNVAIDPIAPPPPPSPGATAPPPPSSVATVPPPPPRKPTPPLPKEGPAAAPSTPAAGAANPAESHRSRLWTPPELLAMVSYVEGKYKMRVDPYLVVSIICQESNQFGHSTSHCRADSGVTSSGRAMGLMQILPSSSRIIEKKTRKHCDAYKVECNLFEGITYLQDLQERKHNNLPAMLREYSGGAGGYYRLIKGTYANLKSQMPAVE